MIQSPCVQPAPVAQQPNYNAVKIDIHNPSVGVNGQSCPQPQTQAQYSQPAAQVYDYPQSQVYGYPAAAQPCYYPPVATVQPGQSPQQVNVNYPQAPQQVPQQAPVSPEQAKAPEVPAPVVSEPEVVKAEPVQPEIDLNGFIAKLSNPDFEQQKTGMEDIAAMIKADEKDGTNKSTALVDTKVFNALNNILSFDSSKLEGPSQEQIDARQKILDKKEVTEEETKLANTMTPKELAERNKSYALFTIAMLDKLYADEVAKLSNNVVPLTDLPEAVNVVNQLKDNPNPMVRASAIEALNYVQRPEYNKDLTTLFEVAKKDQDPGVVQTAEEALKKISENK